MSQFTLYFSLPSVKLGLKQEGQTKLVGIEALTWSGSNVGPQLSVAQRSGPELAGALPGCVRPLSADRGSLKVTCINAAPLPLLSVPRCPQPEAWAPFCTQGPPSCWDPALRLSASRGEHSVSTRF